MTTSRRRSSWSAGPPRTARSSAGGLVGSRLRDQIHGQMRDAVETDRMLMQRPPSLVHWSRINGPAVPFEYAVMVTRDRIIPAPTNSRSPDPSVRTLTNVLRGCTATRRARSPAPGCSRG